MKRSSFVEPQFEERYRLRPLSVETWRGRGESEQAGNERRTSSEAEKERTARSTSRGDLQIFFGAGRIPESRLLCDAYELECKLVEKVSRTARAKGERKEGRRLSSTLGPSLAFLPSFESHVDAG